jgi:Hint domain
MLFMRPRSYPHSLTLTRRSFAAIAALGVSSFLSGCKIEGKKILEIEQKKPNCFLKGTRILTTSGYSKIEDLNLSDRLIMVNGEARPVIWLGRYIHSTNERHHNSYFSRPVLFRKDSLTKRLPLRDLYLSRDHRLYINGMLVRVGEFVSAYAELDVIEYYHLMTKGGHGVIFAEGVPCETLLPNADSVHYFEPLRSCEEGLLPVAPATPYAPIFDSFASGNRALILSRLRSAFSPWFDFRTKYDIMRDALADYRSQMDQQDMGGELFNLMERGFYPTISCGNHELTL